MDEGSAQALNSHKGEKLRKHSVEDKLAAIEEAKKKGNRAAARILSIDEKRIREWRSKEGELLAMGARNKRFRLDGAGRHLISEVLELRLVSFVEDLRAKKLRVTNKMIRREGKRIWQSLRDENPGLKVEFKASFGFVQRFNERNNFVYRRRTTVAQKPPQDYIPKIISFVCHIRRLRLQQNYDNCEIIGCDETPVWFEGVGATTVNRAGAKDVALLSTGHEKMRCTVMLSAKADGRKLKPYVVLKRKRPLTELEKQFPEIVLGYSGNGWMNESLTADYLRRIIGSFSFKRRLLVWDSYRCHIMNSTKQQLVRMKVDTAVVPAGCTKFVQPADVSWNKSFKSKYNEKYDEWMAMDDHEYTGGGRMRAPPLEEILKWIRDAWSEIPEEQIKNSFLHCGVSNALDGSDDDRIVCLRGEGMEEGRRLLAEANNEGIVYVDNEEDEDQLEDNEVVIDEEENHGDEEEDAAADESDEY